MLIKVSQKFDNSFSQWYTKLKFKIINQEVILKSLYLNWNVISNIWTCYHFRAYFNIRSILLRLSYKHQKFVNISNYKSLFPLKHYTLLGLEIFKNFLYLHSGLLKTYLSIFLLIFFLSYSLEFELPSSSKPKSSNLLNNRTTFS